MACHVSWIQGGCLGHLCPSQCSCPPQGLFLGRISSKNPVDCLQIWGTKQQQISCIYILYMYIYIRIFMNQKNRVTLLCRHECAYILGHLRISWICWIFLWHVTWAVPPLHSEVMAPMLPGMIPYSPARALVAPLRVTQSFFSSS